MTISELPILDAGYIRFIESWGSDYRIIEAARMSTSRGFQGWGPIHHETCPANSSDTFRACVCEPKPGDEKLLAYLYNNKHMTPFEMAGMVIEIKAPIFVFREWHRHRTQSYNEMSARYIPLPDENYTPSVERLMTQGGANKQAQSAGAYLHGEDALTFQTELDGLYRHAQAVYVWGISHGVPKELARLSVPVARYSRMRASANLRNWLQFLTLRMDSAAQWEIRQYANAVGSLIEQIFPRTWDLFTQKT